MGKKRGPARSLTAADKAAAERLHAIWMGIPKDRRPSQAEIAERFPGDTGSQSLVSQYMLGRIALNYRAVKIFARALNVPETAIRTDLPEQLLNRSSSDPHSPGDVTSASHLPGISPPILDLALELFEHEEQQAGRIEPSLARAERLAEFYRRIEVNGGQRLGMADLLKVGEEIERRRGKDERQPGKHGSKLHRGKQ